MTSLKVLLQSFDFLWKDTAKNLQKRLFIASVLLVVFLFEVCYITLAKPSSAVASDSTTASAVKAQAGSNIGTSSNNSTVAIPDAQDCTPAPSAIEPTPIELNFVSEGLTFTIDTPNYYQLYGYTTEQIRGQMRTCAPHVNGESSYSAYTNYQLSWSYSYIENSEGLCTVIYPKVGLHVSQLLPTWQANGELDPSLINSWNRFSASLVEHENGHTALDKLYAQKALTILQSFPATACNTIEHTVSTALRANVDALDAANESYDRQTGHGTTQGAVF